MTCWRNHFSILFHASCKSSGSLFSFSLSCKCRQVIWCYMVYCWFTLCFYLQKIVNKEQTHCWFPVMRVDAGLRALRIISLQESSLAKQKTGWVEVSCMGVDGLSTWQMRVEQMSKTFWAFEKVMKGWSIKIFRYVRSLCIRKSSTTKEWRNNTSIAGGRKNDEN